jgi:hypothetical protein
MSKAFVIFEYLNPILYDAISKLICFFNGLKGRKRVLIYTDSRGFEVTKPWNRKNPFSSYVSRLILRYQCDYVICPEKFTSIIDFIDYIDNVEEHYDVVILHCGIVDYAPRPESSYKNMVSSKSHLIKKYQLESYFFDKCRSPGPNYEGEPTYAFMTPELLNDFILPKLLSVNNMIYIGCNKVLSDWQGNYWRKRPSNINTQLQFDKVIMSTVGNCVDMSVLSDDEVRTYTTDNVHYNKSGFKYILSKIESFLP